MYNIPFGKPMIGKEEKKAVMNVMDGSTLVHGPVASQFERNFANFTGAQNAVSVSSCTAGMHLIYFALGLGKGDEVIVPAQTHVATAHAVELTGARPVFIDSEDKTGNIDISKIESLINTKTRAIAVVHYLGVPVNMPLIMDIAKKYNLFVLEDCALSLGATINGIHTGLHGDAGVFSFYPVKHITSAEGGMIILKNDNLAKRLSLLKAFGINRTHTNRKIPGVYDSIDLGFNYRMSEIHAAIGVVQIKKISKFLKQRKKNFLTLKKNLKEISYLSIIDQPSNSNIKSSYYCLGALLDENLIPRRSEIISYLSSKGIGSSIYYPHPVPRMKYYKDKYGYSLKKYNVASKISDSIIAFPVGPHLDEDDMKIIADEIKILTKKIF
jgi:perosamine synthetase